MSDPEPVGQFSGPEIPGLVEFSVWFGSVLAFSCPGPVYKWSLDSRFLLRSGSSSKSGRLADSGVVGLPSWCFSASHGHCLSAGVDLPADHPYQKAHSVEV